MMRVPNGSLARTKPRREHGRHIFAYCNVQTNQVLYSLTQALNGTSSLKQLPDAGANNNPPKLRKDLWRPLWSVTLPDGENGLAQGLHAFRQLQEYRKLHELSWDPPPELTRHTTQEEMDEIQEYLDDRGGKKTETVHDIIKRRKKKIRQRMVMDQKANSIADLAAVLIQQDETGAQREELQEQIRTEEREVEVNEMLELSRKANRGELGKMKKEHAKLVAKRQANHDGKKEDEQSNRSITRTIRDLDRRIHKMQFAQQAVAAANAGMTLLHRHEYVARSSERQSRLRIRRVKEEIQAGREGDETAETDTAPSQTATSPVKDDVDGIDDLSGSAENDNHVRPYSTREIALELEMVRQLHARPERIERALSAYKPRQTDIARLYDLSTSWTGAVARLSEQYRRQLHELRNLQAALDGGETEFAKYAADNENIQRNEEGVPDFAGYEQSSPLREARIGDLQGTAAFLDDISRMMSETASVEDARSKTHEHQESHPDVPSNIPVLRACYLGKGSRVRSLGPARAYALVVAKAEVESRAAQLAEDLKNGVIVDAASQEAAEVDTEATGVLEEGEGINEDAEASAEPTFEELSAAAKEYQRLKRRVWDIDNVETYESVVSRLANGNGLNEDPVVHWMSSPVDEKLKKYEGLLAELRQQKDFLAQAREVHSQPDGEARLLKMVEGAKERSKAAHETKDDVAALQHRYAAKVYGIFPRLKSLEEVIMQAPESIFEGIDEEVPKAIPGNLKEEQRDSQMSSEVQKATDGQETGSGDQVDYDSLLPSWPQKSTLPKERASKHKNRLRNRLIQLRRPIFTTAGITVKWHNILDAEYAEEWPQDVRHERMGLSRHTAPKANAEPVLDVAEWKNQENGGYKGRRFEREMERKAVRESVRGVTGRVIDAVVRREAEAEGRRLRVEAEERERRREAGGKQASEAPMEI